MTYLFDRPGNAGVIDSLCRKKGSVATVAAPDAFRNPYLECGSHPEIVERVWDQLGAGLPPVGRRILCGTPVLVHPDTEVVIAVSYGTSYCLRVPEDAFQTALQAGCSVSHRWGDGKVTDLSVEFGPGWVFGCWAKDEVTWCQAASRPNPPVSKT